MELSPAPLPHEWMIASIIGFFVSLLYVYPSLSKQWGAAFAILFFIVFIASIVNMTQATTDPEHLAELAIHEKRRQRR